MIRAKTVPIRPVPTMPTARPCKSKPSSPSSAKFPSRTRSYARWNAPIEREDERDRMLGHRVGRVRRHARDADARLPGSSEVHVVETRRAERDEAGPAVGQGPQDRRTELVVDEGADARVA